MGLTVSCPMVIFLQEIGQWTCPVTTFYDSTGTWEDMAKHHANDKHRPPTRDPRRSNHGEKQLTMFLAYIMVAL